MSDTNRDTTPQQAQQPVEGERVDLGISALLHDDSSAAVGEPPQLSSAEEPASEEPRLSRSDASRYEELCAASAWGELAAFAEQRRAQAANPATQLEAQLWWVRAQLEGELVPSAILIAPLESAIDELEKLPNPATSVRELGCLLLSKAAERQAQNGDRTAAIALRERAWKLGDTSQRVALQELIGQALREIEQHPGREFDAQLSRRHQALLELQSSLGSVEATEPEDAVLVGTPVFVAQVGDRKNHSVRNALLLALIAGALVIGGYVAWQRLPGVAGLVPLDSLPFRQQHAVGGVETALASMPPTPIVPTPERVARVSDLDALYYDVQRMAEQPSPVARTVAREEAPAAQEPAQASPAAASAQPVRPKTVVDTSGPIEPEELRARITRGRARPHDESAPAGVSPFDDDRPPMFPGVGGGAAKPPGKRSPFAQPSQGRGEFYTVIARTSILARPRYNTEVLGELEPGDRIKVEAKFGEWLRVVSRRGEFGFVFAQDARLLDEKAARR